MKKQFLMVISVVLLTLNSCSSENAIVESSESIRSPQMVNFSNAMRSLGDPANRPTLEERQSGSAELRDRRKQILVPSSIELIKSTGVSDKEIQRTTNGDASAIIVWAMKINLKKNSEISTKLKLQN